MTSLELIKEELESEGYSPVIHKIKDKEILFFSLEDENRTPLMNTVSNIIFENGIITLTYFVKLVDVKKEFKTIKELMKFVRQVFPI
ncbi:MULTISPECIES: hypothetical protein [unclassified Chryseobacterium]|uniref:hypothetical protein n=1 Tax=unclassified Chryseobacterium TaxID=2593645 RepID=UPI001AE92A3E|nr:MULTISPECIES: hypothetical protein [unclassified Chryseobacterium]MBP1166499.1 hypothetical protein [Chryseobacterium sp. PvR013]MDR4891692.1 hypothetical protein [Chryseobacterium sp. CFS7]